MNTEHRCAAAPAVPGAIAIIPRIPPTEASPLHRPRARRIAWALTAAALLYSAAHFAQSGVAFPLASPNLLKFEEQTPALREHLRTGEPVHVDPSINSVQYGPVFFFAVQPLLTRTHDERQLANWLYAIQIVCLAGAFFFTWQTVKPLSEPADRGLLLAWLAVIWLNFAPVFMTIAIKSVENWELLLLTAALYAYVRGRLWVMAFAVASAALIKVLPLFFLYYLLIRDRPAFLRATAAVLLLLAIGHAFYGPEMGFRYLPDVARRAVGSSYGLTWHENLSLKAATAKLFGHLGTPQLDGGYKLRITNEQLRAAVLLGDAAVIVVVALLTWILLRTTTVTSRVRVWEWSLVTVVMLIVSPNTTFEYATLALGAVSYCVVRLVRSNLPARGRRVTWAVLGAAMLLLGALLPRQVLNRIVFVEALNRWTGYTHLTPSEAYQFYCFPLIGLLLLTAALWRLRPLTAAASASAGSSPRAPSPRDRRG